MNTPPYNIEVGCLEQASMTAIFDEYQAFPETGDQLARIYGSTIAGAVSHHDRVRFFGQTPGVEVAGADLERVRSALHGPYAEEVHATYEGVMQKASTETVQNTIDDVDYFLASKDKASDYYRAEEIEAFHRVASQINMYVIDPVWIADSAAEFHVMGDKMASSLPSAGLGMQHIAAMYRQGMLYQRDLLVPIISADADIRRHHTYHELTHASSPQELMRIGFAEEFFSRSGFFTMYDSMNEAWTEIKTVEGCGIDFDIYTEDRHVIMPMLDNVPSRVWDNFYSPVNIDDPNAITETLAMLDEQLDYHYGEMLRYRLDATIALKGAGYVLAKYLDDGVEHTLRHGLVDNVEDYHHLAFLLHGE